MTGQRNGGHRAAQASRAAGAASDSERLAAAWDWFRSSLALLARRRPPAGIPQSAHQQIASRLAREVTSYLTTLATAIDRGDYDAQ